MPKLFRYDVIQLLEGIRDRPCLWDKTLEVHKDRVERRVAWEQIFTLLDPRYEEMSREEKRAMGDFVLNKWTNLRDTFIKSLKYKAGKRKRKYILHDHLKFLIKTLSKDKIEDEPSGNCTGSDEGDNYFKQEKETENSSSGTYKTRKRSKREPSEEYVPMNTSKSSHTSTKIPENTSAIDFVEVNEDPRVMNEDEAFFASLLPTIVKYNEDERLQFRIEVLAVMKGIKDQRNWTGCDE